MTRGFVLVLDPMVLLRRKGGSRCQVPNACEETKEGFPCTRWPLRENSLALCPCRRVQCRVNHPLPFIRNLPALLLRCVQRAQWIEVEKVSARSHAWTCEHSDAGFPVIVFVGMSVAFPAAPHRIHDKGRRVEPGGMTAHVLLDIQSRLERRPQIFHARHHVVKVNVV